MANFVATPSATDANSYLTVEDADDLMDGFDQADKWDELEEVDKQALLLEAARRIDQYIEWGARRVPAQRLAFPRATDKADAIPEEVRLAVCEYVNYKLEGDLVPLKKLQGEGVTQTSILGQSSTFAADPSGLPAGVRRELDKLVRSHFPQCVTERELDGSTDPASFFG